MVKFTVFINHKLNVSQRVKHIKKWGFRSKVSMVIGIYNHVIYYIEWIDENMHDSKTIELTLNKSQNLYGISSSEIIRDQGYREKNNIMILK
jgi:hypothetical protein